MLEFILKVLIIFTCTVFVAEAISPVYYIAKKVERNDAITLYSGGKEVEILSCNRGISYIFTKAICFNEFDGKIVGKQFIGTYTVIEYGDSLKEPNITKKK